MAGEEQIRIKNRLGISQATLNEVQGILIGALAIFCVLSIVSLNRHPNLIGPVGERLAQGLVFLLGQAVAYAVPGVLLLWAMARFCGVSGSHPALKLLGVMLVVAAGCGLLAQVKYEMAWFALEDAHRDSESFEWGGLVGSYLVSSRGANLPFYLGRAGTYLTLSAAMAIGILLATNFLFYQFFRALWTRLRQSNEAVSRTLHRRIEEWKATRTGKPTRCYGPREMTRVLGHAAAELPGIAAPAALPEPRGPEAAPAPPIDLPILEVRSRVEAEVEEEPPKKARPPEAVDEDEAEDDDEQDSDAEAPAISAIAGRQLDFFASYQIPPVEILTVAPPVVNSLSRQDIEALSLTVEEKLATFGIGAEVTQVTQGPVVTLFEIQPAPGVKVSRIATLDNDLAMALRATRLRIIAPIPGRGTVGIEIPNRKPSVVLLREIIDSREFQGQTAPLAFALGKTIEGKPYVCNLAKMPHLLIAGTTGSGKSVCINAILCSMLLRNTPDRVRFIMIDPKRVELSVYQGIPHLLAPVVCEPRKSAAALAWVVGQMEERYRLLAAFSVRSIDAYNKLAQDREQAMAKYGRELPYMPHIVIVVDELADLMLVARNEVEENIIRLAQMSRAVGIHLIIATQRPSVNVITGIIKANFPCRIAFQVSQKVDSRTILDMNGAEALLGQGDMLFSSGGSMRPIRVQGAFVADSEVERLVKFITDQGQAMTEEQLAAEREIDSVQEQAGNEAVPAQGRDAARNDKKSDEDEVDLELDEDPHSIDDAERFLGADRERPPVHIQYAVDDFMAPVADDNELTDELYERSLRLILESKKASVSLIQRRLKIGYARAGRLMDLMEDRGIVGPYQGSKPRLLLVDPVQYLKDLDGKRKN
jgi:S-DNA-T family DNA segregation ATPase FtsK/SpoIIIE